MTIEEMQKLLAIETLFSGRVFSDMKQVPVHLKSGSVGEAWYANEIETWTKVLAPLDYETGVVNLCEWRVENPFAFLMPANVMHGVTR